MRRTFGVLKSSPLGIGGGVWVCLAIGSAFSGWVWKLMLQGFAELIRLNRAKN
jgi:hypothetical protein